MDAPGNAKPPPLPPSANGKFLVFGMRKLSLRETLLALFLFPHIVLLADRQQPIVKRAALLVALVILVCCGVLGVGRSSVAVDQAMEPVEWLGFQMGELRRTDDGSLAWNRAPDAPQTLHHDGYRIDFPPPDAKFSFDDLVKTLDKEDGAGLWISPREIRFWTISTGRMSWPIFSAASDRESLNWKERFPPGSVLPGDQFSTVARKWLRPKMPIFVGIGYLVVVLSIYLIFLAMFTVLPILLRRSRDPQEGKVTLCVNLHCSVVPMIVTTVYHLAAPRWLDFPTLFVLAFLGYLIWAYSRVRRFLAGNG